MAKRGRKKGYTTVEPEGPHIKSLNKTTLGPACKLLAESFGVKVDTVRALICEKLLGIGQGKAIGRDRWSVRVAGRRREGVIMLPEYERLGVDAAYFPLYVRGAGRNRAVYLTPGSDSFVDATQAVAGFWDCSVELLRRKIFEKLQLRGQSVALHGDWNLEFFDGKERAKISVMSDPENCIEADQMNLRYRIHKALALEGGRLVTNPISSNLPMRIVKTPVVERDEALAASPSGSALNMVDY